MFGRLTCCPPSAQHWPPLRRYTNTIMITANGLTIWTDILNTVWKNKCHSLTDDFTYVSKYIIPYTNFIHGWMTYTQKQNNQQSIGCSTNLQESSSALAVLPAALRPERPDLTFIDLPSERLPGVAEALSTRLRPGTHSKRSWQPFKHTSKRPEDRISIIQSWQNTSVENSKKENDNMMMRSDDIFHVIFIGG